MNITALNDLRTISFDGREFGVFQDGELLAGDVYSEASARRAVEACACGEPLDAAGLELLMLCEEHREHAADCCELCHEEDDEDDGEADDE